MQRYSISIAPEINWTVIFELLIFLKPFNFTLYLNIKFEAT